MLSPFGGDCRLIWWPFCTLQDWPPGFGVPKVWDGCEVQSSRCPHQPDNCGADYEEVSTSRLYNLRTYSGTSVIGTLWDQKFCPLSSLNCIVPEVMVPVTTVEILYQRLSVALLPESHSSKPLGYLMLNSVTEEP